MRITRTQFGPVTHRWLNVIFGYRMLGLRVVELKVPTADVDAMARELGAWARPVTIFDIPIRVV